MGSRLHGNDGRRTHTSFPQQRESTATTSSFPRRRESMAGGRGGWVPVSTGTTDDGRPPISSFPRRRESTAGGGRMGPRLHAGRRRGRTHNRHPHNGGNPRPPISSFPRRRESMAGGAGGDGSPSPRGRRWASTSSFPRQREGGDGFPSARERRAHPHSRTHPQSSAGIGPHIVIPAKAGIHGHPYRHSREGGNPWRGAGGDGSPSPRERRWASTFPRRRRRRTHNRLRESTAPISSFPRRREWVPVSTGTTDHPGGGGNPRPPISSFPRRRESMAGGGGGWVPVSTGTTMGIHIVIPATAGGRRMGSRLHGNDGGHPQSSFPATAGGRGMGSRLHGNDGRTHIVIPAKAGIHGGEGPGDGSPSPRGRRWASTSSFPRQREGGDGFPSPRERRWAPTIVIPARQRGAGGWVPVSTGTTMRTHIVIARENRAPGMGSRLHANDGGIHNRHSHSGGPGDGFPRRRESMAPISSFPRRRESMAGRGRGGWVPVSTGTTVGIHIVIPATAGGGDGFPPARERRLYNGPSPRERRWAQRAPTIVGGRSSCPWRGSGGTLCCRPTS